MSSSERRTGAEDEWQRGILQLDGKANTLVTVAYHTFDPSSSSINNTYRDSHHQQISPVPSCSQTDSSSVKSFDILIDMPSGQPPVGHTIRYSDFRATIPPNTYVSQTTYAGSPSSHRHEGRGFVVMESDTFETLIHDAGHTMRDNTFFDHQRRYNGNRRAHHVVIEEVVDDNSDHANSSSDNIYDSDVDDGSDGIEGSEGSDFSDDKVYAEAQGNPQSRVPERPKLGRKPHKQEGKNRGNAGKAPVNYYERLGIQRGASDDEIKKAAKKMRVQVHPHRLITPATSAEEITMINERACEVGEAAEALLNSVTASALGYLVDATANALNSDKNMTKNWSRENGISLGDNSFACHSSE
ncbi:hypothetical protein MMC11_002345 [Xylographa trunciseda]|nr:hypothetical protein [Xylographa trunciseda]